MERIAVTGVGCITALGNNYAEFSKKLFDGYCGVDTISLFDKHLVTAQQAAEVKDFIAEEHFDKKKQMPFLDRFAQFALMSAREAVTQSAIPQALLAQHSAVIFGTGIGGQTTQDEGYWRLYGEKAKRLPPYTVPKLVPSSAASHISIDLGITGPSFGVTSSCASAGHAISVGAMMLQSAQCDIAICGGAEAPLAVGVVKAWEAMRVLSRDHCRPFSAGRGGVILGEGAASLILENYAHAQRRGAPILAELVGFGMSSDANHVVAPTVDGPISAMRTALNSAQLKPNEIDYINAHGSGTQQNDTTETAAIHTVFGNHAVNLAISSTKAMHGHTLGAASAVEAVACIAALQQQIAPATINYQTPDPKCDLNYLANAAKPMDINYVMSNSFAFGGLNTSLIFKRASP